MCANIAFVNVPGLQLAAVQLLEAVSVTFCCKSR